MTEHRDPEYARASLAAQAAVISVFALHHPPDERKRTLYAEIRACLVSGGAFLNLEHVASVNETEHARLLALLGGAEDFSNRLAPAWTRADAAYQS